ncbi:MAG: MBL fold metallo-hydrolase [Thermoproteota archaeon]
MWETELKSYEEALEKGEWHPDAGFISHAHLDHCGYVPFLGDIPLVCSDTTRALMESLVDVGNLPGFDDELTCMKRRQVGRYSSRAYFPGELKVEPGEPQQRQIACAGHRETVSVADGCRVTLFDVGHSIPGSAGCLVESGQSQVVYTGDLRFHGRSGHNLGDELAGLHPDVILCEGTRIDQEEPDDEQQVEEELTEIIEEAEGLVMVAFAWKDLERYETVKEAALSAGRVPVFDPRLAYLEAQLGDSVYQEGGRVFLERSSSMLYSPGDYTRSKHKAGEIPVQ